MHAAGQRALGRRAQLGVVFCVLHSAGFHLWQEQHVGDLLWAYCRLALQEYENLGVLGEGTYGTVVKARHRRTGCVVAIKQFKEPDDEEQVILF